jgi:hypothetical protein
MYIIKVDNEHDKVVMMCLPTSLATSSFGPCALASVSITPGCASSLTPITIRSFHILSLASSMVAGGRAIHFTSIASEQWSSLSFFWPLGLVTCWDTL